MKRISLTHWAVAAAEAAALLTGCQSGDEIVAVEAEHPTTFCNPVDVDYRFMVIGGGAGIREAADPVVVRFKDKYLLFASKSSGYWYSDDFTDWHHVIIPDGVLPIEDYAPAILVHEGYVYYVGSTRGKAMLYRSDSPETGRWEKVKEIASYWDPAFCLKDGLLYVYSGSSPVDPLQVQAFHWPSLEEASVPKACFNSDKERHGWERTGEHNELERRPYLEGAWMTEHNGKFYLQYAAPGTEWKTYADGAYVADAPDGPFRYLENSPVSYKPAGFMSGAGHGCLFEAEGQWWKAATNAISVRHMFERRVSFYPAGFDKDGHPYTNTYLGDYPLYLPGSQQAAREAGPGWMLLSYRKPVQASSALSDYPATNAVDEESRTGWVAATNGNEWLQVDLTEEADICALQVNYDEYGATCQGVSDSLHQSYRIYASHDGRRWSLVVDRSAKRTDRPHEYIEFERPFRARYLKWENVDYSIAPQVSLRDFRIFGRGNGTVPAAVTDVTARQDMADPCKGSVVWKPVDNAEGYVVRYGIAPDKLYTSIQVQEGTSLTLTGLNAGTSYWFTIDAYNRNGVTKGGQPVPFQR